MPLEDEFRKANSTRIVFKGREVFSRHEFPVSDGQRVRVVIESYDSDWGGLGEYPFYEGVGLMIDRELRLDGVSCGYLALWPYDPPLDQIQPPYHELLEIATGYYLQEPRNTISLWLRRPFDPIEVTCHTRDGHIHVWNVWNDGNLNHGIDWGHNGAGMIVQEIEDGFRYQCNDGYPDEDFDDIVFRIERL